MDNRGGASSLIELKKSSDGYPSNPSPQLTDFVRLGNVFSSPIINKYFKLESFSILLFTNSFIDVLNVSIIAISVSK